VPVVVITMVTETSALAGFQVSGVLTKPIRADEVVAALLRAGLHTSNEVAALSPSANVVASKGQDDIDSLVEQIRSWGSGWRDAHAGPQKE